ncbi:MAG: CopG family transcriptional regulator [Akkermansiaceae bacterium]
MRTTLNLDDDILATAKALAAQQRKPVGEVVSTLVRRALKPSGRQIAERNGIPLFPMRKNAKAVTPEIIRELLEDEM